MDRVQVRYFDALRKAAEAINSTLSINDVLNTIVKTTTEVTRVKGCSLMLFDEDKKQLKHTASYGLSDQYLNKGVITAERSLSDALKGEIVVIPDTSNDKRLQYPEEAVREGINSMLSAPLTARGKTIGIIRIYSPQKGEFSKSAVELLTAIANLSAIAIQNAKIYDSLMQAHKVCQQELWHWQP